MTESYNAVKIRVLFALIRAKESGTDPAVLEKEVESIMSELPEADQLRMSGEFDSAIDHSFRSVQSKKNKKRKKK